MDVVPEYIEYDEYLKYLYNTNCVLDIESLGGGTIRLSETVAYGKRMITNNPKIMTSPLFDSRQMLVFDEITDDVAEFVKNNRTMFISPKRVSTQLFLTEVCDALGFSKK